MPKSFSIFGISLILQQIRWEQSLTSAKVSKSINLIISIRRGVGGVHWDDKPVGAQCLGGVAAEDVTLDEDLVVGAGVDGLVVEVIVEVVVEMLMSESTSCGYC